jgi:molecular chaperone DnaK
VESQQPTTIFGIDLGTTYSCIAYVDEYGKAVVIPNAEGDLTTPSVVLFEGKDRVVVGKEAKNSAVLSPEHVVSMIKREMGNPDFRFSYDGTEYSPQEISAYVLRKLKADAEQHLNRPVQEVVITCPAYFGLAEREATRDAGELAGLTVREIINEPTAAAIDFGLHNERDQTILVYDLGGGTFDVTIMQIHRGAIQVIATGGDHRLGGRDWDEQVVLFLAEAWRQAHPESSSDPLDSLETQQDLWQKAETAKRTLTARSETRVAVVHEGLMESVTLTREKFDELTQSKLEQTIQYTQQTLAIAREKGISSFDTLLLVGGSSRMPQVKERLMREFPGIEPRMHDPDQAVAKGAALYGQKLAIGDIIRILMGSDTADTATGQIPEDVKQEAIKITGLLPDTITKSVQTTITNVASHGYGVIAIDPARGDVEQIFNLVIAQDTLPCEFKRIFGTHHANQESVEIRIYQNDMRAKTVDDLSLGVEITTTTLGPLPPNLPARSPIEVSGTFNEQGLLHVVARDLTGGGVVEVRVETKGGLTPEEKEEALARSRSIQIV